jgi:3',5'-nucleoside bisphosphate phosphatase
MKLCDFHIHSQYSDGVHSIRELVDLYGEKGFHAIAITDHLCENKTLMGRAAQKLKKTLTEHNFDEYLEEIEYESKRAFLKFGMLVLSGVEITKNYLSFKKSAHVLAIGIHSFLSPDLEIPTLIGEIQNQGALAVAAHPLSTGKLEHQTLGLWDQRHLYADLFDAWEVNAGKHFYQEVYNSQLPILANSDLHHKKQLNSWKTLLDCDLNFSSIKEAIKKQNIQFVLYE